MTLPHRIEAAAIPMGREAQVIDGIAYIIPLGERIRWARRIGRFAIGASLRWSSFGFGVDLLQQGALVQVGPAFVWFAALRAKESSDGE